MARTPYHFTKVSDNMADEQQTLPILHTPFYPHEPGYPMIPVIFVPKGITRIQRGTVRSFEEALWCVVDAYREAEAYARTYGDHRWADELHHFGDLFRADAHAFLDCYVHATWQAEDEAERQRIVVAEFSQREGEFVGMICDALLDITLLACVPDELVDMWLTNEPGLAVHDWPKR